MTENTTLDKPDDPRSARHLKLWGSKQPLVGMIHLPPLPGSPRFEGSMERIVGRATSEALLLSEGGLDGIIVENYGDTPFFPQEVPPETVAGMALAVQAIVSATTLPVGVNVLRNDASAALAVAATAGARFIRVNVHSGTMFTDQGPLVGQSHVTLRKRAFLDPSLTILADVMVKHGTPPPGLTLTSASKDTWARGLADGLIVTGSETGYPVETNVLTELREALPDDAKIWVGSGADPESVSDLLSAADGIIVGSALQRGGIAGGGCDPDRIQTFVAAANRIRARTESAI